MKYFDIVLATASPRRKQLIQKIKCVRPVFMPTEVEEVSLSSSEETAIVNARAKGEWAAARTSLPVLAFDTVVSIDGETLGKPHTAVEAIAMFEKLCGRTHEVITAVFFSVNKKNIQKIQKSSVTFCAFNIDLVYNYVESGAPFDKAGGYNIADEAIAPLIAGVSGDIDNVEGLPVALTEKLIEENLIHGKAGYCD